MNGPKVIGKIIKLSKHGWGFISSRDIEFTRIFFHWTALRQDTVLFPELQLGMFVEFTPVKLDNKGYRAVHIRVVERPPVVADKESHDSAESESEVESESNLPPLQERRPDAD